MREHLVVVLDLLKNEMSVTGRLRMRDKNVFPSDIYPDICKIRIKIMTFTLVYNNTIILYCIIIM